MTRTSGMAEPPSPILTILTTVTGREWHRAEATLFKPLGDLPATIFVLATPAPLQMGLQGAAT